VIEVHNLSKRYKKTLAVDSLSFTVKPGWVTGFLGPNGAGKSTTMRLMLGLDRPTTGEVLIDGKPYAAWRNPLRKVGAVFEGRAAHGGRTGYQHLKWLAQSNGIPLSRVGETLQLVGLSDSAGRRAGRYSLGMAQRLGIAAALLGDPPILLLDEPVNGLDPEGIIWIRELMRNLAAQGRTVLVSSHFMAEMAVTAEHLVVIARGRLVADTTVAELTTGSASLEEAFINLTRQVP
jgi:ABC-2 type transport system ATP-binding protein